MPRPTIENTYQKIFLFSEEEFDRTVVELNLHERKAAINLAQLRNEQNIKAGNTNNRHAPDTPSIPGVDPNVLANAIGARGEIASARMMNLYYDTVTESQKRHGYDLKMNSGCTVDVKGIGYHNGLLVVDEDTRECDAYLLVYDLWPKTKDKLAQKAPLEIIGWILSEDLKRPENLFKLPKKSQRWI